MTGQSDVVVVGAGLAGLSAALRLADAGARVVVVAKGSGGLQLSQGTLDVLGYVSDRVSQPYQAFDGLATDHPYRLLGVDAVRAGVDFITGQLGGRLFSRDDTNWQLPTAVGAIRPTLWAQASMTAADLTSTKKLLVVGLRRLKDFPASLVAENLNRSWALDGSPITARHTWLDFEIRTGEADSSGMVHARALDDPAIRGRLARLVAAAAADDETVLLPGVLGLTDPDATLDLQARMGRLIAEVPLPPPGVPGLRLHNQLMARARAAGVRFIIGSAVVDHVAEGGCLVGLVAATTGHPTTLRADAFVLATGGFESGALAVDSHGRITETALGLPLSHEHAEGLIDADFWGSEQRIFTVGVRVDQAMRPVDSAGLPVYSNLFAAGGILAGAARQQEKSGDGIAVASGVRAADQIVQEAR